MFELSEPLAASTQPRRSVTYTPSTCSQRQFALFQDLESPLTSAQKLNSFANHGEVFTRRWVVELILDLVGYNSDEQLADQVAVEPACGRGAFLLPMVERLIASCRRHGTPLADAADAIRAFDLLSDNVDATRTAANEILVESGVEPRIAKKLAEAWIVQDDFLLGDRDEIAADYVVGNPPYIRLEEVPEERSSAYRNACPTMGGRADIFIGFYEHGLKLLKSGGRLGYICADRWMRNAYGKALRSLVAADYAVEAVVTMHDVDAFEDRVAAYPAVTIVRAGQQGPAAIVETTIEFGQTSAATLRDWFKQNEPEPLHEPGFSAAWLNHWFTTQAGWPTGSPDRLALIADLEERFPLLEETGAKVGIGLATGADDVYLTKDPAAVESDRLLPMVMRSDIGSGEIRWSGHHLINPWTSQGLVKLSDWPGLAAYIRLHWETVVGRNVGSRNPGREHRTIDRVIEGLQDRPKLLLADMSMRIWPVLDEGRYYPHHNLYWIHEETSDWDLKVLGGLLLSDVAELFVSTYCVRMRGGTLRFQAQYLRRIRVPHYADISDVDRAELSAAFEAHEVGSATAVALRVYGIENIPS